LTDGIPDPFGQCLIDDGYLAVRSIVRWISLAGFVRWRVAGGDVLFGELIEVELKFGFEFRVDFAGGGGGS
jgi:hypothetical protein